MKGDTLLYINIKRERGMRREEERGKALKETRGGRSRYGEIRDKCLGG